MLLQGFLALLFLALLVALAHPDLDIVKQLAVFGPSGAAVALIAATPLAMLVGLSCDRLGERFLLANIAKLCDNPAAKGKLLIRLTRSVDHVKSFQQFKRAAEAKLQASTWNFEPPLPFRGMAEALMFERERKDTIEWIIQHYSACRLACGFMLTLLAATPFLLMSHQLSVALKGWCALGIAALIYGLLATAVDQYLYSYEAILHEALCILSPPTAGVAGPDAIGGKQVGEIPLRAPDR